MSNLKLVHTTYHVVSGLDGTVLLSTSDFRVAKMEQIDRFIHSMPCSIDTSTRYIPKSVEEQLDESITAHH